MNRIYCIQVILLALGFSLSSQNDQDALRYSQTFFGGTSRSKAMAGSFGALGADGSCMAINPAGIGLYRKGDINISFGFKNQNTAATHNQTVSENGKANLNFDGLSLVAAWDSDKNKDAHHSFGLSANQLVNFGSQTTIQGTSNQKSIMNDVLATTKNSSISNLDPTFAGLAFETYLLDTIDGKFYSFVNTNKEVIQSKTIQTSGRINEWCFNYAYGLQDKMYFGVTLGIPNVNFSYSSEYTESDTKDSIRINNYDYPVYYYNGHGGFSELRFEESYRTTGTGYNLKLGAIYRATDFVRFGLAFHTPTFFNLTDTYTFGMYSKFDEGKSYTAKFPADNTAGRFTYQVVTPSRLISSVAFIIQKMAVINIDYDYINYSRATLGSSTSNFSFANETIKKKYTSTGNLKAGLELNFNPYFVRFGYASFGSPFGEQLKGDFVRNFYTGGVGFKKNKFYVDLSFTRSLTKENYYMYNSNYVDKSVLTISGTTIAFTVGSKF
jgi:hypothetical protein